MSIVVYDDSLEGAARFAVAVLHAQVISQGRDWSPKLAHTAYKKLEAALNDVTHMDIVDGGAGRSPA